MAKDNNRGIWFDRDGVDPDQAQNPSNVNGATYNTHGVYDVDLTFTQTSATTVAVCPTVNGIPTTFYTTTWAVDFSPAGIGFAATEAQMKAMQVVVSGASDGGFIIVRNLTVDGVPSYTHDGDCPDGAKFVNAAGGTETLNGLVAGHKYSITASGTYYAGGAGIFDIQADAEWSQDAYQRANGLGWTELVRQDTSDTNLLDLMIDGQGVDWGAYSPTHTYTLTKVAVDGTLSFAFNIYDSYPSNNVGGLCVSLTDLGNIGTFNGFFQPVDNVNTNVAKAGQTIPVKWQLLDYNGQPVSDSSSFVSLTSQKVNCGSFDTPTDLIEEVTTNPSGLLYQGDGNWQFNWKTPKTYAGTCRIMTVTLSDGSTHSADFQFK